LDHHISGSILPLPHIYETEHTSTRKEFEMAINLIRLASLIEEHKTTRDIEKWFLKQMVRKISIIPDNLTNCHPFPSGKG